MPRPRQLITSLAAVAIGLATAAVATAAPAGAATRPVTNVYVSKDGHISMPTTLYPGRAHFAVIGPSVHNIQLVKPRHGAGKAQLIRDVDAANRGAPPVALERDFRFTGGVNGNTTMYKTLYPGTYYVADTRIRDLTPDRIVTLTVRPGPVINAPAPTVGGEIRAVGEASWPDGPMPLPHDGFINFVNASDETHFVLLLQMRHGKTIRDVRDVLHDRASFPSVFTGRTASTGVLSAGGAMTFHVHVPSGRYALMCFWTDLETGMPHAFMGMYRVVYLY